MKTKLSSIVGMAACAVLLTLAASTPANAQVDPLYQNVAFADDFSSGTDAAWTHVSIFALSGGQTWNASTGAYEITAPNNGYNPGTGKYGFAASVATGLTLTDGYVQSDVVTWQGNGIWGPFGVGARLGNLSTPLGITGYSFVYVPTDNGGNGGIELQRLGPPSIFNGLGHVNVSLTPGQEYTMTLETSGSSIVGTIWNVGQAGISMVAQVSATDATYASGAVGLFVVGQAPMPTDSTTFDNFLVVVPEPGTGALLLLGLAGFIAGRRVLPRRS